MEFDQTIPSGPSSADVPDTGKVLELRPSKLGRTHGKAWKDEKTSTRRSQMPVGLKSSFEKRREKEMERKAVLAVEAEMREDVLAERERKSTRIRERRERKEEKARLEAVAAKMSAKKLQRMRKRQGRSKKING